MSRRRLTLALTALALAIPLLVGTTVAAQATTATPGGGSSTRLVNPTDPAHPYSDPVFYPSRQRMRMDCYKDTQGCNGEHKNYQLSLVANGSDNLGVFAMGSGRVTRVDLGKDCGPANSNANFGTEIEIYHGGGVYTRYGHLKNGSLQVSVGDLVSAGAKIATMGNTGAKTCAANPYIDFYIEKAARQVDFATLSTCVSGATQSWPRDQYAAYDTWSDVPKYSVSQAEFPNPTTHPGDTPDGSCVPTSAPASPSKPAAPKLANAGAGHIKATWSGQPAGTGAMVELQVFRKSLNKWQTEDYGYVGPGVSSYTFGGLDSGTKVRAALAFHDAGAWSLDSGYSAEQGVGSPPDQPTNRSLKTGRDGSKAYIYWGWKGGKVHGFPVTRYILAIRKGSGSWKTSSVAGNKYNFRWNGLTRHASYTVRVKGRSAVGDTAYLVKSITTAR